jgi:acetyl-CoA carboxylase carboxyltransferase component
VYKDELRKIRAAIPDKIAAETLAQASAGLSEEEAGKMARQLVAGWAKSEEQLLAQRYERELMNPNEALSLGSISQIVMPSDLRQVLADHMSFCLRHYTPEPLTSVQREFH